MGTSAYLNSYGHEFHKISHYFTAECALCPLHARYTYCPVFVFKLEDDTVLRNEEAKIKFFFSKKSTYYTDRRSDIN